jgi:hypothetical protein
MEHPHMSNGSVHGMRHQGGFALIAILALLAVWGLSVFVGQLSATQFQTARAQNAAAALVEAREALLGDAIARSPVSDAGYFSLPDLGAGIGGVPAEGQVSPTFAGDGKDLSVIGRFPWKTLDTTALRDAQGECLWYIVSGRFKNELKTDALNWDTQGQIDIIDGTGNLIARNLAAMVIAPQIALDGQSRALADPVYRECGGNYDARNYLDPIEIDNAIAGEVNYFVGSTNNRVAPNTSNKRFVMADSNSYNDRFLYITVDDIFNPLIRRSDFAGAIGKLLDSPVFQGHLRSIVVAGNKGTDNINCANGPDLSFCRNWKEMLFLTERSVAEPINVNGTSCSRVLIFAGRKAAGQSRSTALDKTNKDNYLEGVNASSFNVPTAASPNFSGAAVFDWRTPSTDLVRCLP